MGSTRQIDTATFDAEVLHGPLPAVVDFSATWCGPCQALAPEIDALGEEFAGQVLICKVDVDQDSELASRYGVMSVPTVLLFKNGERVDDIRGNFPDKIRKKIQELILDSSENR